MVWVRCPGIAGRSAHIKPRRARLAFRTVSAARNRARPAALLAVISLTGQKFRQRASAHDRQDGAAARRAAPSRHGRDMAAGQADRHSGATADRSLRRSDGSLGHRSDADAQPVLEPPGGPIGHHSDANGQPVPRAARRFPRPSFRPGWPTSALTPGRVALAITPMRTANQRLEPPGGAHWHGRRCRSAWSVRSRGSARAMQADRRRCRPGQAFRANSHTGSRERSPGEPERGAVASGDRAACPAKGQACPARGGAGTVEGRSGSAGEPTPTRSEPRRVAGGARSKASSDRSGITAAPAKRPRLPSNRCGRSTQLPSQLPVRLHEPPPGVAVGAAGATGRAYLAVSVRADVR